MRVIHDWQPGTISVSACALGMFDGVHMGHRQVLQGALNDAKRLEIPSAVFSFANHPQQLTSKTPTLLLSSLDERLAAFEAMGFDVAMIPPFDERMLHLSAHQFVDQVLVGALGVQSVTVGYDFRFGYGRSGDGAFLTQSGQTHGFETRILNPVKVGNQIVSSTLIRRLLGFGDIEGAVELLGRPYHLPGVVVHGHHRGQTLGFPTANLKTHPDRLIPATGTYAGYGQIKGQEPLLAVCNIGYCPTFDGEDPPSQPKRIEVHLLEYAGPDFYGAPFGFDFVSKIRDEQKFPSVDALVNQIQADCAWAKAHLPQNHPIKV